MNEKVGTIDAERGHVVFSIRAFFTLLVAVVLVAFSAAGSVFHVNWRLSEATRDRVYRTEIRYWIGHLKDNNPELDALDLWEVEEKLQGKKYRVARNEPKNNR